MPTYSQAPRLLKGAIVAVDLATSRQATIAFQYNPVTVKRSREPQMAGGEGGQRSLAVCHSGAPVEIIDVEVTIDAFVPFDPGTDSTANVQLSVPRQCRRLPRQVDQGHTGIGPAPPAARVRPEAEFIRPLLVKPGGGKEHRERRGDTEMHREILKVFL